MKEQIEMFQKKSKDMPLVEKNNLQKFMVDLRAKKGINVETMSWIYGCSRSMLSMIENGKRNAPLWYIRETIDFFDFDVKQIKQFINYIDEVHNKGKNNE